MEATGNENVSTFNSEAIVYTNPMFVRRSTYNETRHISVQTHKGTEEKALHKPDVYKVKCA